MSSIFTASFWRDAVERAVKTAAQSTLVALGASDSGFVNLFEFNLSRGAGFAAGGAFVSLLTSIVSAPLGATGTASLLPAPKPEG